MNSIVGHNLRQVRLEAGVSLEDLARELSTTVPELASVEAGQSRLRVEAMFKVCQLLRVKPKDLFKCLEVRAIQTNDARPSV